MKKTALQTKITLVRHGETDWNAAHRWQGMANVRLNDKGRAQAGETAKAFVGSGVQHIVSSDLYRTAETAEIINETLGVPMTYDKRLREIHVGDVQGLDREGVKIKFPKFYEKSILQPYETIHFPNGESRKQLAERASAAVQDILDAYPGQHVLLVSHGGTISMLLWKLLPKMDLTSKIRNCSITRLCHDGERWTEQGIAVPCASVVW